MNQTDMSEQLNNNIDSINRDDKQGIEQALQHVDKAFQVLKNEKHLEDYFEDEGTMDLFQYSGILNSLECIHEELWKAKDVTQNCEVLSKYQQLKKQYNKDVDQVSKALKERMVKQENAIRLPQDIIGTILSDIQQQHDLLSLKLSSKALSEVVNKSIKKVDFTFELTNTDLDKIKIFPYLQEVSLTDNYVDGLYIEEIRRPKGQLIPSTRQYSSAVSQTERLVKKLVTQQQNLQLVTFKSSRNNFNGNLAQVYQSFQLPMEGLIQGFTNSSCLLKVELSLGCLATGTVLDSNVEIDISQFTGTDDSFLKYITQLKIFKKSHMVPNFVEMLSKMPLEQLFLAYYPQIQSRPGPDIKKALPKLSHLAFLGRALEFLPEEVFNQLMQLPQLRQVTIYTKSYKSIKVFAKQLNAVLYCSIRHLKIIAMDDYIRQKDYEILKILSQFQRLETFFISNNITPKSAQNQAHKQNEYQMKLDGSHLQDISLPSMKSYQIKSDKLELFGNFFPALSKSFPLLNQLHLQDIHMNVKSSGQNYATIQLYKDDSTKPHNSNTQDLLTFVEERMRDTSIAQTFGGINQLKCLKELGVSFVNVQVFEIILAASINLQCLQTFAYRQNNDNNQPIMLMGGASEYFLKQASIKNILVQGVGFTLKDIVFMFKTKKQIKNVSIEYGIPLINATTGLLAERIALSWRTQKDCLHLYPSDLVLIFNNILLLLVPIIKGALANKKIAYEKLQKNKSYPNSLPTSFIDLEILDKAEYCFSLLQLIVKKSSKFQGLKSKLYSDLPIEYSEAGSNQDFGAQETSKRANQPNNQDSSTKNRKVFLNSADAVVIRDIGRTIQKSTQVITSQVKSLEEKQKARAQIHQKVHNLQIYTKLAQKRKEGTFHQNKNYCYEDQNLSTFNSIYKLYSQLFSNQQWLGQKIIEYNKTHSREYANQYLQKQYQINNEQKKDRTLIKNELSAEIKYLQKQLQPFYILGLLNHPCQIQQEFESKGTNERLNWQNDNTELQSQEVQHCKRQKQEKPLRPDFDIRVQEAKNSGKDATQHYDIEHIANEGQPGNQLQQQTQRVQQEVQAQNKEHNYKQQIQQLQQQLLQKLQQKQEATESQDDNQEELISSLIASNETLIGLLSAQSHSLGDLNQSGKQKTNIHDTINSNSNNQGKNILNNFKDDQNYNSQKLKDDIVMDIKGDNVNTLEAKKNQFGQYQQISQNLLYTIQQQDKEVVSQMYFLRQNKHQKELAEDHRNQQRRKGYVFNNQTQETGSFVDQQNLRDTCEVVNQMYNNQQIEVKDVDLVNLAAGIDDLMSMAINYHNSTIALFDQFYVSKDQGVQHNNEVLQTVQALIENLDTASKYLSDPTKNTVFQHIKETLWLYGEVDAQQIDPRLRDKVYGGYNDNYSKVNPFDPIFVRPSNELSTSKRNDVDLTANQNQMSRGQERSTATGTYRQPLDQALEARVDRTTLSFDAGSAYSGEELAEVDYEADVDYEAEDDYEAEFDYEDEEEYLEGNDQLSFH